jgi:hypothetical protein
VARAWWLLLLGLIGLAAAVIVLAVASGLAVARG